MSKSTRLQACAPDPSPPARTAAPADRISGLLEAIARIEQEIELFEERRPALQARLDAAMAGLCERIVAARTDLLRLLERRLRSEPGNRRLQRDGIELLFDLCRDLEERFGADVREFTDRWGASEGGEEDESVDLSWFRPDPSPKPPTRTVRRNGALDPEAAAKGIYRALARELHPDKTREAGERERRTGLMQSLTQAWQERDLGALLRLLHAHGSVDAREGALEGQTLEACLSGLEERRLGLETRRRELRHRQLPAGVADWMPLVLDPALFEKILRRHKAPAREEIEFLGAVRAWWLRPGGLEECLADPPQGLT